MMRMDPDACRGGAHLMRDGSMHGAVHARSTRAKIILILKRCIR